MNLYTIYNFIYYYYFLQQFDCYYFFFFFIFQLCVHLSLYCLNIASFSPIWPTVSPLCRAILHSKRVTSSITLSTAENAFAPGLTFLLLSHSPSLTHHFPFLPQYIPHDTIPLHKFY